MLEGPDASGTGVLSARVGPFAAEPYSRVDAVVQAPRYGAPHDRADLAHARAPEPVVLQAAAMGRRPDGTGGGRRERRLERNDHRPGGGRSRAGARTAGPGVGDAARPFGAHGPARGRRAMDASLSVSRPFQSFPVRRGAVLFALAACGHRNRAGARRTRLSVLRAATQDRARRASALGDLPGRLVASGPALASEPPAPARRKCRQLRRQVHRRKAPVRRRSGVVRAAPAGQRRTSAAAGAGDRAQQQRVRCAFAVPSFSFRTASTASSPRSRDRRTCVQATMCCSFCTRRPATIATPGR